MSAVHDSWALVVRVLRLARERAGGDDVAVYLHEHGQAGPFAVLLSVDHYTSLCERANVTEAEAMRHDHADGEV